MLLLAGGGWWGVRDPSGVQLGVPHRMIRDDGNDLAVVDRRAAGYPGPLALDRRIEPDGELPDRESDAEAARPASRLTATTPPQRRRPQCLKRTSGNPPSPLRVPVRS